jgi:hypothetical protein
LLIANGACFIDVHGMGQTMHFGVCRAEETLANQAPATLRVCNVIGEFLAAHPERAQALQPTCEYLFMNLHFPLCYTLLFSEWVCYPVLGPIAFLRASHRIFPLSQMHSSAILNPNFGATDYFSRRYLQSLPGSPRSPRRVSMSGSRAPTPFSGAWFPWQP